MSDRSNCELYSSFSLFFECDKISWLVLSNKVVHCQSLKNSLLPLCCKVMLLLCTNEAIPIISSYLETRWGSQPGWLYKNLYLCLGMSFATMQIPLSGFFFWWVVFAAPQGKESVCISHMIWSLISLDNYHNQLLYTLKYHSSWKKFVHLEYYQLMPLVRSMATLIKKDYY